MLPGGRRVVSASFKELKVWDIETGEGVATLKGYSGWVRRAASASCSTFVMIWLCRRSAALPCFRTGGASFLVMGTMRRQE